MPRVIQLTEAKTPLPQSRHEAQLGGWGGLRWDCLKGAVLQEECDFPVPPARPSDASQQPSKAVFRKDLCECMEGGGQIFVPVQHIYSSFVPLGEPPLADPVCVG